MRLIEAREATERPARDFDATAYYQHAGRLDDEEANQSNSIQGITERRRHISQHQLVNLPGWNCSGAQSTFEQETTALAHTMQNRDNPSHDVGTRRIWLVEYVRSAHATDPIDFRLWVGDDDIPRFAKRAHILAIDENPHERCVA